MYCSVLLCVLYTLKRQCCLTLKVYRQERKEVRSAQETPGRIRVAGSHSPRDRRQVLTRALQLPNTTL